MIIRVSTTTMPSRRGKPQFSIVYRYQSVDISVRYIFEGPLTRGVRWGSSKKYLGVAQPRLLIFLATPKEVRLSLVHLVKCLSRIIFRFLATSESMRGSKWS